jgi:hypothetical protein
VQFWFVLAGAVCVLMALVSFFIPALMHLDDTNGERPAANPLVSAPIAMAVEAE